MALAKWSDIVEFSINSCRAYIKCVDSSVCNLVKYCIQAAKKI